MKDFFYYQNDTNIEKQVFLALFHLLGKHFPSGKTLQLTLNPEQPTFLFLSTSSFHARPAGNWWRLDTGWIWKGIIGYVSGQYLPGQSMQIVDKNELQNCLIFISTLFLSQELKWTCKAHDILSAWKDEKEMARYDHHGKSRQTGEKSLLR